MLEEKRKILTKTIPFLLIGLALLLLYLYFIGFSNIIEAFSKVNPGIFALATLMTFIEIFLFTFTWHYLLRTLSIRISFPRAFSYVLTGIFVDILVPAESVSAEISKIYLMNQEGADIGKVTATLVIQRIYGMIITAVSIILACLGLFVIKYPLPSLVIYLVLVTVGLTFLFLTLLLIFCFRKELTEKVLGKILGFIRRIIPKRFDIQSWEKMVKKGLDTFYPSLAFLANKPRKLLVTILSAVASWIAYLLVSQFVFYSLGYPVSFLIIVVVYSLSTIIQSIPAGIPAEVGVTEIVMSSLYGMFGVPLAISAVATLLIRFLNVWLKFILGFIALQWVGIKIIVKKNRNQ